MTLPASDLMMATLPILYTPKLKAAVTHYRDMIGFEVVQHVPGVVALLRLADVTLYLWQRAVDDTTTEQLAFKPGHHRVAVKCAFITHSRACEALKVRSVTSLLGTHQPELQRLSGPPQLQSWGAWEFSLADLDGNVIHFVQWVTDDSVAIPATAATPAAPSTADAQSAPRPRARPAPSPKQNRRA